MSQTVLDVPEDAMLALHSTSLHVGSELRMAAAAKLYELGRLSSGAAARLPGITRTVLLSRLAEYGVVSLRLSHEDMGGERRH